MEIFVGNQKIILRPNQAIGKGGEADIFNVGGGNEVVKIFKSPTHPDLIGFPEEQEAARRRIEEQQKKLPAFPKGLPGRVIQPQELAFDKGGRIAGYTMRFLKGAEVLFRFGERSFREGKIPNQTVVEIFRDLYPTVAGIYREKAVIGDSNDLNVLVLGSEAYLIDADSFQFGPFLCRVFTARFVDPLLCQERNGGLMLNKPHNENSDWYAYLVMFMRILLYVDPYGGTYRPKDSNKRIPHDLRPLKRITVFDPEVRYPKPAIPYGVLPDDLLHHFFQVFVKDQRGIPPFKLVDNLRWTKCTVCGEEHARDKCPKCAAVAPAAIKEVEIIRGKVTSTRIFKTSGLILFAAYQRNNLFWLYHENQTFKREDGSTVIAGAIDPFMRFRICSQKTLIGLRGQVVEFNPLGPPQPERISVDSFGLLPVFDANGQRKYWLQAGQLLRDGILGSEYVGDILEGQTLFWVGAKFGFGFYRAGNLNVAFVFDAESRGLNDRVKLPSLRGQLVDSTCVFTSNLCWFFVATKEGGKIVNRCVVINQKGAKEAAAEAEQGDGSWLSDLRGKCAVANFLLVATDDGVVRIELQNERLIRTREFPDTEQFVNSGCHLFSGQQGLFVVDRQEIRLLKIN